MENFNTLKIDDRLNRDEVEEVIELSKDEEKIKILLETNQFFNDFIESEYKWANENYLGEGWKTVKDLQVTLWFSWNDVNWVFSKQTFFALIKFQKENNLIVDWLVWEKTQAVMYWNKELTNSKIKEYFKIKENDLHLWSKWLDWWLKLANFLELEWFPTYEWWAMCGLNVWEALIDFWISWLPTSWRDGYTWSDTLDNNPSFIKKPILSPSEALPWWILVYDKWFWSNKNRKDYGHVEIKTNNWYWYWWKEKNKAWWSTLSWFTGYVYYPKVA